MFVLLAQSGLQESNSFNLQCRIQCILFTTVAAYDSQIRPSMVDIETEMRDALVSHRYGILILSVIQKKKLLNIF